MPKCTLSAIPFRPIPLWISLLTPTARAAALRENRGYCLDWYEDTHSLKQCRHPFIDASSCLNPDCDKLGDDRETYRRWQARMIRYRREDKPSCPNNQKKQKTNRRLRGHSHGQQQSQRHQNNHKDD